MLKKEKQRAKDGKQLSQKNNIRSSVDSQGSFTTHQDRNMSRRYQGAVVPDEVQFTSFNNQPLISLHSSMDPLDSLRIKKL